MVKNSQRVSIASPEKRRCSKAVADADGQAEVVQPLPLHADDFADAAVSHASPSANAVADAVPAVVDKLLPLHDVVADVAAVSNESTLSKAVAVVGGQAAIVNPMPLQAGDAAVAAVANEVASPSGNRARFMANCQPMRVGCDLRSVGLQAAGVRFSFQAVIFVVYPPSEKPDRRHVLLIDATGCTGLTVWGAHVPLFTFATVGTVVKFTKLSMVVHNGKKSLSMSKDSSVVFVPNNIITDELKWWLNVPDQGVKRIIDIHDCDDDTVVNVSGIVGSLTSETKRVRADNKDLLHIRLTDRTGHIDVRSWNHSESEFARFLEKPLQLQRVRVSSFAGTKILELLDGVGTVVVSNFEGQQDLESYWKE